MRGSKRTGATVRGQGGIARYSTAAVLTAPSQHSGFCGSDSAEAVCTLVSSSDAKKGPMNCKGHRREERAQKPAVLVSEAEGGSEAPPLPPHTQHSYTGAIWIAAFTSSFAPRTSWPSRCR